MEKVQLSVLIVDDEKSSLDRMTNIISRRATEVYSASHAKEATKLFRQHQPDIVISDIFMPDMDGLDMLKSFKKENDSFKSIVISAYTETGFFLKAIDNGVDLFLVKPVDKNKILTAFNKVVNQIRLEHDVVKHRQELVESERKLRESNLTKDKFFSIISHDLKSPLSSVISFSDMLINEYEDLNQEEIKQFLQVIRKSAGLTLDLLNDILDWSRAQTGKIFYKPSLIEMPLLIEEMIDLMKNQADKKEIRLLNKKCCSEKIWADKNILQTVLRNLISNAIKFTDVGGEVVINSKEMTDGTGQQICIFSVSDNGIGMPKDKVERLFQINDDISKQGTAGEKGTGLGLSLCKELINVHGGEIKAKSELRKGTTISFSIPKEKRV